MYKSWIEKWFERGVKEAMHMKKISQRGQTLVSQTPTAKPTQTVS